VRRRQRQSYGGTAGGHEVVAVLGVGSSPGSALFQQGIATLSLDPATDEFGMPFIYRSLPDAKMWVSQFHRGTPRDLQWNQPDDYDAGFVVRGDFTRAQIIPPYLYLSGDAPRGYLNRGAGMLFQQCEQTWVVRRGTETQLKSWSGFGFGTGAHDLVTDARPCARSYYLKALFDDGVTSQKEYVHHAPNDGGYSLNRPEGYRIPWPGDTIPQQFVGFKAVKRIVNDGRHVQLSLFRCLNPLAATRYQRWERCFPVVTDAGDWGPSDPNLDVAAICDHGGFDVFREAAVPFFRTDYVRDVAVTRASCREVAPDPLLYHFENGSLQGWTARGPSVTALGLSRTHAWAGGSSLAAGLAGPAGKNSISIARPPLPVGVPFVLTFHIWVPPSGVASVSPFVQGGQLDNWKWVSAWTPMSRLKPEAWWTVQLQVPALQEIAKIGCEVTTTSPGPSVPVHVDSIGVEP